MRPQCPAIIARCRCCRNWRCCLATSGSTGGAKAGSPEQSRTLIANAESIVAYLEMGAGSSGADRLAAYSYGLSVIHSHLLVWRRIGC